MPQWTISVFTGGGKMVVGERERAICSEVMTTQNRKTGSPHLQKKKICIFSVFCDVEFAVSLPAHNLICGIHSI